MNICGCLVHVAPSHLARAQAEMGAMYGVEIHAATEDGRLVVVVEDTDHRLASELIMDLHQVPGVVSLTLTYHHFETAGREPSAPASRPPASSPRPVP